MNDQINQLFKSQDFNNIEIATQILIGKGISKFEILQYRYKNGCYIYEEEAKAQGIIKGGTLKKCLNCGNKDFKYRTIDTMQGLTCEKEAICKLCKRQLLKGRCFVCKPPF